MDGKKFFRSVFEQCKTPESDRVLLSNLEKPSSPDQATCFVKVAYRLAGFVSPDGTADTKKISQQFVDYGYPVPKDVADHGNINIEKDTEKFAQKAFAFYSNNRSGIKTVFFGIPSEEEKKQ